MRITIAAVHLLVGCVGTARYHGTQDLHYANTPLLTKFVSRFGKILPRSQTHLSTKMQRKLARVIKCSRQAGLMPYKGTWNSLR